MMRIAVDARALSTRPTGVGHFLLAAVNAWSAKRPDVCFELLSHKALHPAAHDCLRQSPTVRFHQKPGKFLPGNGLFWLEQCFERLAVELGATHLWGPGGVLPLRRRSTLPRLLTVHDLVYLSLPQTMAWRTRVAYTLLAGRAIRQADLLWCVSDYTAGEVERHFPSRRSELLLTGSGLNPLRQEQRLPEENESAFLASLGVHDRTLLFVGTLEPRKNLSFLLSLMPALAEQGCRLLVVGCSGWGADQISRQMQTPGFPRSAVHFCDYLSDAELQTLYRRCAFFISTSLLEGFGLPQLEAMATGCPVIAAANSAVIEVVSEGGILIEGWDLETWVRRVLEAFSRREALRAATADAVARHQMLDVCLRIDSAMRSIGPSSG